MSLNELLRFYEYISEQESSGACSFSGVSSLSIRRDTGISTKAISDYLENFPDVFRRVGDSRRIAINKFSAKYPISRADVIASYKKYLIRIAMFWLLPFIVLFFAYLDK